MEPVANTYEDAARVYIRLVGLESQAAAFVLDTLHVQMGARTALRAALVVTLFRTEVKCNDWTPPLSIYGSLLEEFPQAIPFVEQAMNYCLEAWALARVAAERADEKLSNEP